MNVMTQTRLLFSILIAALLPAGLFAQGKLASPDDFLSTAGPRVASGQSGGTDAGAQTPSPTSKPTSEARYKNPEDWSIAIYPVLAWAPIFGISTREFSSVPGGGGGDLLPPANVSSSFNGAAFAGFRIEKSKWSADGSVLWAGVSAQRSNPFVRVGFDAIYGQAMGGREVLPNLFLEGGVRRLAVDISIRVTSFPELNRKPGFWDPLVGLTYRRQLSKKWRIFGHADGGGFGVGADVDVAATARAEWQFARHFGLTFGYGLLHFKETNTVAQRSLEISQTLNGPIFGFGIYF